MAKMVKNGQNGPKWSFQSKLVQTSPKIVKTGTKNGQNGEKLSGWSKIAQNGPKIVPNDKKIVKKVTNYGGENCQTGKKKEGKTW